MQQKSCNSIFVPCDDVPDFSGYTLVLPAVSIGNVPQLTVDLLISTLAPKRVGFLHDRALLPVFGCDAYSESGHKSTTSANVYMCEEKNLAIIQQRSPAIKSHRRHLADRLTEWITAANFGSVVLLTSSDANNSGDNTMLANSASLRYVGNQHQNITNNFAQFGWQPWAPVSSSAPYLMAEERARLEKQRVTGGGLTRSLYDACEEKTIPLVTLILFCSEGDNVPDSIFLAKELYRIIDASSDSNTEVQWRAPVSWRSLYGPQKQRSIF